MQSLNLIGNNINAKNWLVMMLVSVFSLNESQAGTVRKIYSDGVTMMPVHLRMGQSTVLRFLERPKKVVLGNSNYYSVEFIENDLALQPLGGITTNLFVYGQKNVYGFILKTNQGQLYDDLVQVDLKENQAKPSSAETAKSVAKVVSTPKISFEVQKKFKVSLLRVLKLSNSDTYVLDLLVESNSSAELDLEKVDFFILKNGRKISPQEIVLRSKNLGPKEMTPMRIVFSLATKDDLTLVAVFEKKQFRQKLSRRFL